MNNSKLIWIVQELDVGTEHLYVIKILDKTDHRSLVELCLDNNLYDIFKKIMKRDLYSLQYIEHPILGLAAKLKLKQSPHHEIKSISDSLVNEKEFYLGA